MIDSKKLKELKDFYYNPYNIITEIKEKYELDKEDVLDKNLINPIKHNRKIILTNKSGEQFETDIETFLAFDVVEKVSKEEKSLSSDELYKIVRKCGNRDDFPFESRRKSIFENFVLSYLINETDNDEIKYYKMAITQRNDEKREEIIYRCQHKVDENGDVYTDICIGRGTWGSDYLCKGLGTLIYIINRKTSKLKDDVIIKNGLRERNGNIIYPEFICGDFKVIGALNGGTIYLMDVFLRAEYTHKKLIERDFEKDKEDFLCMYRDVNHKYDKLINLQKIKMYNERMKNNHE